MTTAERISKIQAQQSAISPDILKFLIDQSSGPKSDLDIILIDIRPRQEFNEGHIDHKYCICIPGEEITEHTSFLSIKRYFADADDAIGYRIWKNLEEADKVVIYDRCQQRELYPSDNKLRILFNLVEGYVFRCFTSILEGGFDNFRKSYPGLITSEYSSGEFLEGELPQPIQLDRSVELPWVFTLRQLSPESSKQVVENIPSTLLAFWKHRREKREAMKKLAVKIESEEIALPSKNKENMEKRAKSLAKKPEKNAGDIEKISKKRTKSPAKKPEKISGDSETINKKRRKLGQEFEKKSSDSETIPVDDYLPRNVAKTSPSLPRGITNTGNSCYIGVIMQCLNLTSEFFPIVQHWLTQVAVNVEACKWTSKVLNILKELRSNSVEPVSIETIQEHARSIEGCKYGENVQQDSHEFLGFLLETIHEELSSEDISSPLQELFETPSVQLLTIKCSECGEVDVSFQDGSGCIISLPMTEEPGLNLEKCLMLYTQQQELLERRSCKRCGKVCNCFHQIGLKELLPRYLIFQINRFRCRADILDNGQEQAEAFTFKLSTPIEFSQRLDLRPFVDSEGASVTSSIPYDVYAIVNHEGESMDSGHYTAYGRTKNTWFQFNDSTVKEVSIDEMKLENSYLFFLERFNSDTED